MYSFPSFAPLTLLAYPSTHLYLPPRRDLLHRAIVFEGDAERQGTKSTKYRREVYGSGRKLFPQKGRGRARVGDKKSPTRRGGGLAHPPKPRDHASRLNVKMYDRAWRTALSLRYRRGELVVVDGVLRGEGEADLPRTKMAKMAEAFEDVGRRKEEGTTLWVLNREEGRGGEFRRALRTYWPKDRVTVLKDVDVKMLLEGSRVVIEKEALDIILKDHQADLQIPVDVAKAKQIAEEGAAAMNEAVEKTKQMQAEELEKARAVRMEEIKRIMDSLSESKD
jgi:large subunit ribosomal protein L4